MEKHKCKLCFKSYANGRALGGHMRSHMMNLPIQSKPEQQQPSQLRNEAVSASSSSEGEHEQENEQEKGLLIYGLREKPKKSFLLADPEFAFASSVVLQDRESETESSKNPTRRRSKRTRKLNIPYHHHHHHHHRHQEDVKMKKMKCDKLGQAESWAELEPVSSVSDATTEEDVAFCLMMLSRDKWIKNRIDEREEHEEQEIDEREAMDKSVENPYESDDTKSCKIARNRGKYKCETCNKVFRSYQALGGHRASHKKIRVTTLISTTTIPEMELENRGTTSTSMVADRRIHECPFCYRVFSSGQALGGHKRSHVIGSATRTVKNSAKFSEVLIDLNLPAPVDDDDDQFELSAVSDADFVNHLH